MLLFQFHYGTIKRKPTSGIGVGLWLFQFHYGTIKRSHASFSDANVIYFNSTMVRLKEQAQ